MSRGWRAPAFVAVALSAALGVLAPLAAPAEAVALTPFVALPASGDTDAGITDVGSDTSTDAEGTDPGSADGASTDGGNSDAGAADPGSGGSDVTQDPTATPTPTSTATSTSEPTPTPAPTPAPTPEPTPTTTPMAKSLLGGPVIMALISPPDDSSVPMGTGEIPTMTSTANPSGAIAGGTARTYTVTYENESAAPITNARLWQQIMVAAGHETSFTVSCASEIGGAAGGSCPTWVPSGTETITGGVAGDYYLTFAGLFDFVALQKLTFTVTVTSAFSTGVCTETGNAITGAWTRFSSTGFGVADIEGSASSVGSLSGAVVCPPGDITMTNEVTDPHDPSIASGDAKVLSGDSRTFEVTWKNGSSNSYTGVDLRYTYYVPYTGHSTLATWTCTVVSGSASCPAALTGSATVLHNDPGEQADVVFEADDVDFPAGQEYKVTVTLATTLNTCTQDGELRVQTYAYRSAIGSEVSERRRSSDFPLPIGCTTWLLNETFSESSITDPGWKGLGSACLTAAPSGSTPSNGLGYCSNRNQSPTTTFQMPTGTQKGFLQLTDDRGDQVGAVLYNRALPSSEGLVVEFSTYQYGNDSSGADGIGFFLTDGSYELTATGDSGGALGYAYRVASTSTTDGVAHGYLGVGLDVYGNFVNSSHTAPGCGEGSSQKSQSVGLRGPGNGRTGYCLLAQDRVSADGLTLDKASAGISGSGSTYDNRVRSALTEAKRDVRVTVWPLASNEISPRVTVEIRFPGESYYRTVIETTMTAESPALIKFGFMAATGGSMQVHLLDSVRVGTVLQMKELSITKVVDYTASTALDAGKTGFDVGDTVAYKFVVHNSTEATSGISTIYDIAVTDPLISSITCPATYLDRLDSMECTGSLTVTAADRDVGRIRNTATVVGAIAAGQPASLTDKDTVEVAVNPDAPDALRVIQPGGTASFQVIKSGSALGIVTPDAPARLTLEVYNPNTSAWVAVPASGSTSFAGTYGTWTIDSTRKVTFVHNGSTNYTVTPLTYRVTNAYGGWDSGLLQVTVSVTPHPVCSVVQQRASDRWWAFGSTSTFDFGTTGTSVSTGTMSSLASTNGSFTVTDAKGKLLFVVDSSGTIRNSTGAAMNGNSSIGALTGASPSAVFPAGQGTDKFFVVASDATSTSAGQLRYWLVDMALDGGLGGVVGTSTALGPSGTASMAVTAVPDADGTGYWVVSPDKVGSGIRAYHFDANGPAQAANASSNPVVTTVGNAAISTGGSTGLPTSYEDVRFSQDLTRFATIASNDDATLTSNRTRARLLALDASDGTVDLVAQRTLGASYQLGYSVEFSPDGTKLYASVIATSGTNNVVRRSTIGTSSLGSFSVVGSAQPTGGTARVGADGRLYWARTGLTTVSTLASPNGTGTTWSTQSLASGAASTLGLTNTLVDCAIPAAEFFVEKYDSGGALASGATFALYPDDNGSPDTANPVTPGIVATTTDGVYEAIGISPGAYWIRETTTLTGHSLLAEDVLINVQLGGTIQFDAVPNPQVTLVHDAVSGTYTFKITNDVALPLPLSGGVGTAWIVGGGGALVVLAILGALWWRRRRRDTPDAGHRPPAEQPTDSTGPQI